jgi:hypothetical protein
MNFIAGKYLVEVSRILFFSGEIKFHDVLAQATTVDYFILSNLSFIITMSFLIRIIFDYLTLSFTFVFQIQILKPYCL